MMFNYKEQDPETCEYYPVAPKDELLNGERIFVEIGSEYIVVFNVGGKYYAIADVCSHDDGPLGDGDVSDHTVACPRHGAKFDIRTGEALTLPAVEDIPAYPVRIQDGMIEIGIPRD
jgi:3-phenylpropionate/trans-cinnamate dioxygenase ferredoxin subunit